MKPTAPAVVRSGLTESRWFTESSRSGTVVLGNHPYSVRCIEAANALVPTSKGLVMAGLCKSD